MQKMLIAGAAVMVALAPAAHAQSGCDLVSKLNAEAKAGFAGIKGEQIAGRWHDTTLYMTGADECSVMTGEGKPSAYDCIWDHDGAVAALAANATFTQALSSCLSGWAWRAMTAADVDPGVHVEGGTVYTGSGANAGVVWKTGAQSVGETDKDYMFVIVVTGPN
jgi:hypothetical protein